MTKRTSVTAADPCKHCGKEKRCLQAEDGTTDICYGESNGCLLEKKDGQGVTYWVHRGPAYVEPTVDKPLPIPTAKIANVETRDKVYSALLRLLATTREHRDSLMARGLDLCDIASRRYGSVVAERKDVWRVIALLAKQFSTQVLLSVPGFVVKTSRRTGRQYVDLNVAPGLLIPVRDEQGRVVAMKVRPDKPTGKNKYVWLSSAKHGGPKADNCPHTPFARKSVKPITGPCEEVRVTEGPLKSDIATSLNCRPTLGTSGAGNWRKMIPLLQALQAKVVFLAYDADALTNPEVAHHLVAFYAALIAAGFQVVIETWPAELGKGIDDLLAAGGTPERLEGDAQSEFLKRLKDVTATKSMPQPAEISDYTILLGTDEHRVNDEAVAALKADNELFQRGGSLVQIVRSGDLTDGINRPATAPRIVTLAKPTIREKLTRFAKFGVMADDGIKPSHPPAWCVDAVAARGVWPGVRSLNGVSSAPVLRQDGSVACAAGFDSATGLYLNFDGLIVEVAENPSLSDAKAALAIIKDVVQDFPFAKPEHFSMWLAFLLSPLARPAFSGPVPLAMIDANTRGTGKSLLADVAGIIVTGDSLPRMSNPEDDDEARKRITSLALRGDPLVLIDNVNGEFGCAALDAALTGTRWQDRILGRSEVVDLPLQIVWAATGNNISLMADTSRRVGHIRIETQDERPEERQGFRYPRLLDHVRSNRAKLLSAALTMLRAFHVAGRPIKPIPEWGSFEGWSALVRQAVVWLGLPDPGSTRVELMERSDVQASAIRQLLECWNEIDSSGEGMTTGRLLEILNRHKESYLSVREAILELCGGTPDKLPTVRTVGNKFRHIRGRVIGGKMLDSHPNRKKVAVWVVRSSGSAGSAGSEGCNLAPFHARELCNGMNTDFGTGWKTPRNTPQTLQLDFPAVEFALAESLPDTGLTDPARPRNVRANAPKLPPWMSSAEGGAA